MKRKYLYFIPVMLLLFVSVLVSCGEEVIPETFSITWVNYDGSVLKLDTCLEAGTVPQYTGSAPVREGTEGIDYTFSGWSPELTPVSENVTYVAQFSLSVPVVSVTWKNYDGTVMYVEEYLYGETPGYGHLPPSREEDEECVYVFCGWDREFAPLTSNETYTAVFTGEKKKEKTYTVRWKDSSGVILETDTGLSYGTMPEYNGKEPEEKRSEYSFDYLYFIGWSPEITAVTSDIVYTAKYESKSVLKLSDDGKTLTGISRISDVKSKSHPSLVVPDGVEKIGDNSMKSIQITSISFPDTLKEIGRNAFGQNRYLKTLNLPDSLEVIGDYAFYDCYGLTELRIPKNVRSIGKSAFEGLYMVESITVDSDNPYYYSEGNCLIEKSTGKVILGCKKSVIPTDGSVVEIGERAFSRLGEGVTSISIPSSVTMIDSEAFYECHYLTEITLPASLTHLEPSAFTGCWSLISIKVEEGSRKYVSIDNCLIDTDTATMILGCTTSKIPDDKTVVRAIGTSAFCPGGSIEELYVPGNIEKIEERAFVSVSNLKKVVLSEGLKKVGDYLFNGAGSILSITVPVSLTNPGNAFVGINDAVITYLGNEAQWNEFNKDGALFGKVILAGEGNRIIEAEMPDWWP